MAILTSYKTKISDRIEINELPLFGAINDYFDFVEANKMSASLAQGEGNAKNSNFTETKLRMKQP